MYYYRCFSPVARRRDLDAFSNLCFCFFHISPPLSPQARRRDLSDYLDAIFNFWFCFFDIFPPLSPQARRRDLDALNDSQAFEQDCLRNFIFYFLES